MWSLRYCQLPLMVQYDGIVHTINVIFSCAKYALKLVYREDHMLSLLLTDLSFPRL